MVQFPITSSWGCKYIMVLHDFDSNTILVDPLKSRSESEILWALTALYKHTTDLCL